MINTDTLKAFQNDLRNGMTIEEACTKHNITFKDACREMPGNWNHPRTTRQNDGVTYYRKHNLPDYITLNRGRYMLRKKIKRKWVYFGRYKSLEDAIKVRDYMMEHGWNKHLLNSVCRKLGVEK